MPHDSRWPAWIAVALGLLVILLVLRVATPRVRLTSAEQLGLSTPAQPSQTDHPPTAPRSADDEAESFDGSSPFADLP
jgi:hypothetical protein